ncbi:MAG: hypothetical protein IPP57_10110 [Candidatus Obscuribacter sp.]|jgi:hypothetical protein|nr:hypothetical protein [Candidatus Obscuribacter sp.]MBK9206402.1 hypothetical protein [Candidatus Obscuribacter sp.]MBK9618298.1 hypothetical protein [Candidatus Obscuribacter sp.]MBK9771162.1 hypothetical protein [Candidatus Obscuribacter sp.]MDQ5966829.1 hypothetical protein [Cyanobacteriota bacterium erpe_2018_sw_39hr_WHONDRS-SW48-000098_B_bin.30]
MDQEHTTPKKIGKTRRVVVRCFVWLVCITFVTMVGTKVYLISYAELVAQDFETAQSARLKKHEDRARAEIIYNNESGKTALAKAEGMKQLANYYMESKNYAAARDTLLASERDVASEGDDAEHIYLRIQLKRQAAMCMANCALYEVSEPLLRQAGRLIDHLQKQDQKRGTLARAELLNDQGIVYYLWANSTKELPRRKSLFEQSKQCFALSARVLGGIGGDAELDGIVHLRRALHQNLGLVRQDLAFEPR